MKSLSTETHQLHSSRTGGSDRKERFGYYEEGGKRVVLGSGASGTTYRGWIRPSKALDDSIIEVALKCFNQIITGDSDEEVHESQREFRYFGQLDHRNVVNYLRFFYDDHRPVIATELIEGLTLHELAHEAKVDGVCDDESWVLRVLRWGHQLAEALYYLEQCRIVHRDIKPGNIVVSDEDDRPVLIDFGISRLEQPADVPNMPSTYSRGRFVGTFAFASPEQIPDDAAVVASSRADIGPRTDVYSLGVTLAYALNPSSVRLDVTPDDHGGVTRPDLDLLPVTSGVRELIDTMTQPYREDRPYAKKVKQMIAAILRMQFNEEPAGETMRVTPNFFNPDFLPEFAPINDQVQIAKTLLSKAAADRYASGRSDSIDLDASSDVARRDFRAATELVKRINDRDREWIYSLPTREQWYAGGGVPEGGMFAPSALSDCAFRDAGAELEWISDRPEFFYVECQSLAVLGQDGSPRLDHRHELWPKGCIRLVREQRMAKHED